MHYSPQVDDQFYKYGQAVGLLLKEAGDAEIASKLSGTLYASKSGWIMLSVPNGLVRSLFDAMHEPGIELPINKDGMLNAHISVMRPEEIKQIGGIEKITERGHHFFYNLGPMVTVEPEGWSEMSRVWFVRVNSPQLQTLRKSYGLSPKPNNGKFDFHITVAVRRKNVVRDNAVSKAAELKPDVDLQPHQRDVEEGGRKTEDRQLLFYGLGSGKSLSALSAAEAAGKPYTIVAPASLRQNFLKERRKFTDESIPASIASYTALGKGLVPSTETVIMDEAQNLRNPESKQTVGAKELADKAKHLYLLSATPMVNAPEDLAPLVEMLSRKPMSRDQFADQFVGNERYRPGIVGKLLGREPYDRTVVKNKDRLRSLLKDRVKYYEPTKSPVQRTEEIYEVGMSPSQEALYEHMWNQTPSWVRRKLDADVEMSDNELRKLMAFLTGPRQASLSTYPFLSGSDPIKGFDQSPKLQMAYSLLKKRLDSDPEAKAAVFSNFIQAGLHPYSARLQADNISHGIFHGGLSDAQRKQIVEDYNSGKIRALLIGPSGSEGLSLKGTRLMQILDPHFQATRTNQSIGRGIRYDSHIHLPDDQQNVTVQRFITDSPQVGRIRKFLGAKSLTSADRYLYDIAKRKEERKQAFHDFLKELGKQ